MSIPKDEVLISLPHIIDDLRKGEPGPWMEASIPSLEAAIELLRNNAVPYQAPRCFCDKPGTIVEYVTRCSRGHVWTTSVGDGR